MKRLATIGILLLIVSRCFPSFSILSRDRRAMESHLDDLAVPLLSSLSRRIENLTDLPQETADARTATKASII